VKELGLELGLRLAWESALASEWASGLVQELRCQSVLLWESESRSALVSALDLAWRLKLPPRRECCRPSA
jgi:hypothetical protein